MADGGDPIRNGVTPAGCDGRVRGKDAGSERSCATGAIEDTASCRPVQTRRPEPHSESGRKVRFGVGGADLAMSTEGPGGRATSVRVSVAQPEDVYESALPRAMGE